MVAPMGGSPLPKQQFAQPSQTTGGEDLLLQEQPFPLHNCKTNQCVAEVWSSPVEHHVWSPLHWFAPLLLRCMLHWRTANSLLLSDAVLPCLPSEGCVAGAHWTAQNSPTHQQLSWGQKSFAHVFGHWLQLTTAGLCQVMVPNVWRTTTTLLA